MIFKKILFLRNVEMLAWNKIVPRNTTWEPLMYFKLKKWSTSMLVCTYHKPSAFDPGLKQWI
jgi:hypothetical protein